ncbi:MAG TPA: helix-turn-helix domain-containing protein, partial [Holophagaceae bacterium]|nr:helix-turn-helix domain-containing protein [Holophagaceae bacterium]
MIPWTLLPGLAQLDLPALAARPEVLWIHGESGTGCTTLAKELAEHRGGGLLEAEGQDAAALRAWIQAHPRGVVMARGPAPELPVMGLRLPPLAEHPEAIPALLELMAAEEGLEGEMPAALGRLPCPGNLRELRNRVLRFKLLGHVPEGSESGGPPRFDAEDLATNLHQMEAFLLHRALRRSYGNRAEAARRLGVSRRQLYLLIRRHGDPVRGEAASGDLPQR